MADPVIPVVWWNRNPAAIARGYWDQGMIEALISGELWQVPGAFEFEHHERAIFDERRMPTGAQGAVVVVPARHNADHVDRLNRDLDRLRWVLLILTGDEEGAFPIERVQHHRLRMWVMTPQPWRDYGDARLIGSGWPPGIRDVLAEIPPQHTRNPWAFMGQVTHERRHACAEMLHQRHDRDRAWLTETPGFTQGQPQRDYWQWMAGAKIAPCPSGPVSPDSFRVYEALEAGCVPIADNLAPTDESNSYWQRIFGAVPFPLVEGEWAAQSATIDWCLDEWPRNANRIFAWWQRYKRGLAWAFHDDIAKLADQPLGTEQHVCGAITAVVTSSPSPHHPSIEHLDITVRSIMEQLPGVEIVLVFDGVAPTLEHRSGDYAEYVRRALWAANTQWRNVVPLVLDDWHHQAGATAIAFDEVRTRHVLFVEHDTPMTGTIDWRGIVGVLDSGEIDMVRLHHETAVGEHHAHMMLDTRPRDLAGVPLIRTYQWSQRPHVAQLGWYRWVLRHHFGASARTMIEDVMHGVVASAWQDFGLAGWFRYKLAMYAPLGNMQRSLHLDSRRLHVGEEASGDAKPPNVYAYDEGIPPGAPRPR